MHKTTSRKAFFSQKPPARIAIFLSGRGSNMLAIAHAISSGALHASIACVIADHAQAPGISRAAQMGLPTYLSLPAQYKNKKAREQALLALPCMKGLELVCLAGYMRLVGKTLLDAFPRRIVNMHPSLLPAWKGLHPQLRAWKSGAPFVGASVHLVTEALDGGPVIGQAVLPLTNESSAEDTQRAILKAEHRLYPLCIGYYLELLRSNATAPAKPHPFLQDGVYYHMRPPSMQAP